MKEIQGFPTPQKNYYKVYVNTITYNQSQYIEDCLNGVAIQETTFPFVHHVIDDASTDGEQEVIKAWMKRECNMDKAEYYDNDICYIILAQNKNNINCTVAAYLLKKNLYREHKKKEALYKPWRDVCPYEALCEGDDYWIDSKKLQKQVDFMESHPDYTGVYTNALLLSSDGIMRSDRFGDVKEDFDLTPDIMIAGGGGVVRTVSDMHRVDVMKDYPEFATQCMVGDYPLHIYLSLKGKCRMMIDNMVVYRVDAIGSWTSLKKSRSIETEITIRQNFNEMIDNFDKYSDFKYHASVLQTETFEVYDLMLKNRQHWRLIGKSFPNVTQHFQGMVKIDNFLMTHHLTWLYDILWSIRRWRGRRAQK